MARIVFHSAGYWGDVGPYVPVANALVERGHDVVFALPVGHHELLAGERFELADSRNPFSPAAVERDRLHAEVIERNGLRFGGVLLARYFVNEWLVPYLDDNVDALLTIGAGADLFVTHPTSATTTRIASEVLGVPMVTGHLFPEIVDRLARIPRPALRVAGSLTGDREINRVRRERGLEPLVFNAATAARHDGMLLLWPSAFAPPGPGWSSTWRTTGFTLWRGPRNDELDPAIDAYLDDGEPPVVVTFGSSSALVARMLFEAVAIRLEDMGRRALFLTGGFDNLMPSMQGRPDVFPFAPLPDVLPRASAVVHSGGFGSTAAALTAGVPSIALPLLVDQKANAMRLDRLGLGKAVPVRRRTERLWDALDDVLGDSTFTARARHFARSLEPADGTPVAADEIERVLDRTPT